MLRKLVSAKRKFQRLAPTSAFTPVLLEPRKPAKGLRRTFYSLAVLVLSLPFFQAPLFGMDKAATRLKEKYSALLSDTRDGRETLTLPSGVTTLNPDRYLAGHTNTPHTNVAGVNRPHTDVHTNNAARHVNVPSEVGHANIQVPHTNSHMNSAHVNTSHQNTPHTDVNTPSTGTERT